MGKALGTGSKKEWEYFSKKINEKLNKGTWSRKTHHETDVAFNFLEIIGGKEGRNQKAVPQAKSAQKETKQSTWEQRVKTQFKWTENLQVNKQWNTQSGKDRLSTKQNIQRSETRMWKASQVSDA